MSFDIKSIQKGRKELPPRILILGVEKIGNGAPTPPVAITAPDGTRVEVLGFVDRIDADAAGRAVVLVASLSWNTLRRWQDG